MMQQCKIILSLFIIFYMKELCSVLLTQRLILLWQHGFARNVNWSITDSEVTEGDLAVTLEMKDDSYSRSMWDFSFQALYKVKLC